MEINSWAIAFFVIYAIGFAANLVNLGQGNVPHIEKPTTKGKKGAAGIIILTISITIFCGALGAYS